MDLSIVCCGIPEQRNKELWYTTTKVQRITHITHICIILESLFVSCFLQNQCPAVPIPACGNPEAELNLELNQAPNLETELNQAPNLEELNQATNLKELNQATGQESILLTSPTSNHKAMPRSLCI